MSGFDRELVSGSITRSVWKLAWPAVLLNLINGTHMFVDHVLVGWFVGYEGNAGIGIAWSVFMVVVALITSLFHGMSVLIARYTGKQDQDALSTVAYQTFLATVLILIFLVAPIGYALSPYILTLVHASPDVKANALPYIRVLFTCSSPLFLMFLMTFAMQACGHPKTPLLLAVLTTVLNVIFSGLLITGAGPFPKLGAMGAALATCFAPGASLLIALYLVYRRGMVLQPPKTLAVIPDLSVIRVIGRIGMPTGFQTLLLNLGGVLLYWYIGALKQGGAAQAAYALCYTQLFSVVTWTSWALRNAAGALMGQNIGAGRPQRGKKAVYTTALFGTGWAAVMGSLYWLFPRYLLGLFAQHHGPVLGFGLSLLRFLSFSGLFLSCSLALTGGLFGMGDTKKPMYIAFVSQIVVLLGLCEMHRLSGTLTAPAIWSSILISHMVRFVLTFAVFYRGKWDRVKVDLE